MSELFAIKVLDDEAGDETRSLISWLQSDIQSDDDLMGAQIRSRGSPIRTDEMGVVADLVEVAMQPDGIGTALIAAIVTWLSTRKKNLKVSITKNSQTVAIEAPRVSDIEAVARAVSNQLNQGDAH